MEYKLLHILTFLVAGIIISLIVNGLLLQFAKSLGIRNNNDVVIRWSNTSKPSLGGVSFYIVFLFVSLAFSIVYSNDPSIFKNTQYIGLLIAGTLAFIMGLADDAYNTRPMAKLSIQILCGITLYFSNTNIQLFENEILNGIITVTWVVTLMNSLNMLDNMDGITGTTCLFILLACLGSYFLLFGLNINNWTIFNVAMLGALLGFLYFNVHPSKFFMGDAGSQFIALFVAFFSIKDLWNVGIITEMPSWIGIVIVLVAFTAAASDSLTVTINRLKKGSNPMVGGKDHTTHHLVYAGLNDRQVWYVFSIIGIFSMLLTIIMVYLAQLGIMIPLIIFSLFFIIVFIILYRFTIKYKQPEDTIVKK